MLCSTGELTLHCHTLSDVTGGTGLADIFLAKRSESRSVDGIGGGSTKGSEGKSGGNLHGERSRNSGDQEAGG